MTQYVIIAGNVIDGCELWGPFPSADAANEWADSEHWDCEWYAVAVQAPFLPDSAETDAETAEDALKESRRADAAEINRRVSYE